MGCVRYLSLHIWLFIYRALETAQGNVRRLAQNQTLELPHPDCCETKPENHVKCDKCPVRDLFMMFDV